MATLLVSDTSVLIDLQRGGILHTIFQLPFDIGVPDVLFERELKDWVGPALNVDLPAGLSRAPAPASGSPTLYGMTSDGEHGFHFG